MDKCRIIKLLATREVGKWNTKRLRGIRGSESSVHGRTTFRVEEHGDRRDKEHSKINYILIATTHCTKLCT